MHRLLKGFGIFFLVFGMSAAAQTVTGSGNANTVPVFTTTPATGNSAITSSPITVSGSIVGVGTSASPAGINNWGGGSTAAFNLYANGSYANLNLQSYAPVGGIGSRAGFFRYDGTYAAPAAVQLNDTVGFLDFFAYDGSGGDRVGQFAMGVDGTPSAGIVPGRMQIYTANSTGVDTLRFTAYSNDNIVMATHGGLVGIGTTTPGAALEVNGAAKIDGALNIGNAGIVFPNGSIQSVAYTGCSTNVPTASALAATPTDCPSGQVATGIAANGNAICSALPSSTNGWTSGSTSAGYWVKDPTGHIHQWGSVGLTSNGTSISFPIQFTNAASVVVVVSEVYEPTNDGNSRYLSANYPTVSGFEVGVSNSGQSAFTWIADGY